MSAPANLSLPTGTVTFLFTDIEGSTKLWEAHPQLMRSTLARHDAVLRATITSANGFIFKTIGDAFCAAFALAPDAVEAILLAQRAIIAEPWAEATPIKVRMALHTGAVECRDNDYFGPALNRVARLLSTGHGGQTLLSQSTFLLVRDTLPEAVSLRDLGAHQLKDLARPEHVYQLQHPALRGDFPPIKSLSTHPNNLPQQVTSFIGREQAIAEIKALLLKTRLLTLTASGGSGKTRLCLQVAADALEQFKDGAWLAELAPLADSGLVPQAVATVLGVNEEPGKTITQTLAGHLKAKQLLLILDNCEHVLDAAAQLAYTLMSQCAGLKILASSRETLGIAGEQTYRVASLSLPDRKQAQTAESLSMYESVQLFIDRALLVRADFKVTNQSAPALASLCNQLDGIPMAIELAAARVRSLSVEEINRRLDQRFRLLIGGSRTALPRQQTLLSLIDWSYDLLRDPEKLLLQRLAVFAGGWTFEAAEHVCAGEGVGDGEVLDLLTSLVDKSLVVAEQSGGHSRYGLLETMRQYARDRLMETGGCQDIRERHRDYFLALAEEAEPELGGAEQAEWLRRLEEEHENLRAGLDWSLAETESNGGLLLCHGLAQFWWTRGHLSEGREWCARVLARTGGDAFAPERARVHRAAGSLAFFQSDYAAARAHYADSLAIHRQLGDRKSIGLLLNNLGVVARAHCDFGSARMLYEESLEIGREMGDRLGIANPLTNLGIVALMEMDFASARARWEESLAIYRELADRGKIATTLNCLGVLAFEQGDFASARARWEESLATMRELGDEAGISNSLENLGGLAHELGDYSAARALLREGLLIRRELGDQLGVAGALAGCAMVIAALGNSPYAARMWGAAERLREKSESPLSPLDKPRHERSVAAARAALGNDAAFDHAWQEGRALTLEQAIELALEKSVERG